MQILEELGYTKFRKETVFNLKEGFIDSEMHEDAHKERMIDQMVRNNIKAFTAAPFEDNMFFEHKQGRPLPNTITPNQDMLGTRSKDMYLKRGNDVVDNVKYIRVYDKFLKRPLLYKFNDSTSMYDKIEALGRKGFVLEINPSRDIVQSALSSNNTLGKVVQGETKYEENLEANQNEMNEIEAPEEQYIPSAEDMFGLNDKPSVENANGVFGQVSNPTESDLNSISEEEGTSDKPEDCI